MLGMQNIGILKISSRVNSSKSCTKIGRNGKESTRESGGNIKRNTENEMIFQLWVCCCGWCCCIFFLARIMFFMTMFHSPRTHKFDDQAENTRKNSLCTISSWMNIVFENERRASHVSCHTSSRHGNEAEKSLTMIDFNLTVQVLLLCCCLVFGFCFCAIDSYCVSLLPSRFFEHNFSSHVLKIALTIDSKWYFFSVFFTFSFSFYLFAFVCVCASSDSDYYLLALWKVTRRCFFLVNSFLPLYPHPRSHTCAHTHGEQSIKYLMPCITVIWYILSSIAHVWWYDTRTRLGLGLGTFESSEHMFANECDMP